MEAQEHISLEEVGRIYEISKTLYKQSYETLGFKIEEEKKKSIAPEKLAFYLTFSYRLISLCDIIISIIMKYQNNEQAIYNNQTIKALNAELEAAKLPYRIKIEKIEDKPCQ